MPRKPAAKPQRAKKAAQAKKQTRKLQIKKGGGVAPATFKRARRVDVAAAAGKGQVRVPGGAD